MALGVDVQGVLRVHAVDDLVGSSSVSVPANRLAPPACNPFPGADGHHEVCLLPAAEGPRGGNGAQPR